MRASEICTPEVVFCEPQTTILEAAQLMRSSHVGSLVVTEKPNGERVPVGIVTDRDLVVEVMATELDPATLTVGDIMAPALVTGERRG